MQGANQLAFCIVIPFHVNTHLPTLRIVSRRSSRSIAQLGRAKFHSRDKNQQPRGEDGEFPLSEIKSRPGTTLLRPSSITQRSFLNFGITFSTAVV
jgi:hypothetical protein